MNLLNTYDNMIKNSNLHICRNHIYNILLNNNLMPEIDVNEDIQFELNGKFWYIVFFIRKNKNPLLQLITPFGKMFCFCNIIGALDIKLSDEIMEKLIYELT